MSSLAHSTAFGGACHTSPKPSCGCPWVNHRSGTDPNAMPYPESPYHQMEAPLRAIPGCGSGMSGDKVRLIRFEPGLTAEPVPFA